MYVTHAHPHAHLSVSFALFHAALQALARHLSLPHLWGHGNAAQLHLGSAFVVK